MVHLISLSLSSLPRPGQHALWFSLSLHAVSGLLLVGQPQAMNVVTNALSVNSIEEVINNGGCYWAMAMII